MSSYANSEPTALFYLSDVCYYRISARRVLSQIPGLAHLSYGWTGQGVAKQWPFPVAVAGSWICRLGWAPRLGEAVHMLSESGGGKGRRAGQWVGSQGQGPGAGLPHAATFRRRIQRRLRIRSSDLLFQVIVKLQLSGWSITFQFVSLIFSC